MMNHQDHMASTQILGEIMYQLTNAYSLPFQIAIVPWVWQTGNEFLLYKKHFKGDPTKHRLVESLIWLSTYNTLEARHHFPYKLNELPSA